MTTLEARRREAQKQLDLLDAPVKARDAAQAALAAIEEQIATAQAAEEAERRAAQRRENEIASLRHEHAQLQGVADLPASHMELRDWLLRVDRVSVRLAQ